MTDYMITRFMTLQLLFFLNISSNKNIIISWIWWSHDQSHNQSRNRFHLIGTISYHNSSRGWPLINYPSPDLPNFLDQISKSTFWINFLNQPRQSTFSLNWRCYWLVVCCFLKYTLSTELHMIQVVNFLADHLLVKSWDISPLSTPWWQCGWKLCWIQLEPLSCANVSFISQDID